MRLLTSVHGVPERFTIRRNAEGRSLSLDGLDKILAPTADLLFFEFGDFLLDIGCWLGRTVSTGVKELE